MGVEMKDSGIDWIGEIPKHWQVLPHKRVMRKIKHIQDKYNGEPILSLTMKGVIVRDLEAGGKMPTSFDGYQKIYPGNLLQCLFDIDVTPRCVGLIKDEGLTSPAYSHFGMVEEALGAYYDYLLRYMDDEKCLLHLSKNLRSSLTEADFGLIPTILPPKAEQSLIANFLDKKCAEIDELITLQEQMIAQLTTYKQAAITETVTKGLDPNVKMKDSGVEWIGEIPEHWDVKRLKNECLLNPSLDVYQIEDDAIVSYMPMECLRFGVIKHNTGKYLDVCKYTPFQNEDIVLAKVTPCFENGNIAIARNLENKIGFGTSEIFVLRCFQTMSNDYLFYYLQIPYVKNSGISSMTGTGGLKRVNPNVLHCMILLYPSLSEQQSIANYLDQKCKEIDELISVKKEKIEKLKAYKKSVIFEYVTGKKQVLLLHNEYNNQDNKMY